MTKAASNSQETGAGSGADWAPHRLSPATRKGWRKGCAPPNKGLKFPPEPLSTDEARALIRAVGKRSANALRNRALLTLLYRAGLRIAEALALEPKDVNLETGAIRVLHGKREKDRVVGVSAQAIEILQDWLADRERRGFTRRAPIFCSRTGRRLCDSYVRALLRRLAKRAGIDRRVHPHCLRHTMAAELVAEGLDLRMVGRFLGHSRLDSTDKYLARISPTEVIAAGRAREWRL